MKVTREDEKVFLQTVGQFSVDNKDDHIQLLIRLALIIHGIVSLKTLHRTDDFSPHITSKAKLRALLQ